MGTQTAFHVPLGQRQLFLDDCGIAEIENLKRTMHQPKKKGAVIWPDQPWEVNLQTRCAPQWDPKEKGFKIWLICSAPRGATGATYATSNDGIHWDKPILRQKEFDGSLENNFVTVDPKLEWPANAMQNVVYDPHDPDPKRRFKGFLGCYSRKPIVSPDGVHWKRLNVPPMTSRI